MELTVKKTALQVGYSSHGYFAPFREIMELEIDERENYPFIEMDEEDIAKYADCPAIWVTREPINAFRYAIAADEWEESDAVLQARYPNWRQEIEEIDCSDLYEVVESDDGDDGVLVIQLA